jgi:hypothetical protein
MVIKTKELLGMHFVNLCKQKGCMAGVRRHVHLPIPAPTLWVEWVYPPVGKERTRNGMKGKRIRGVPLSHDGNDGWEMY